ncbi:hypothetical protein T10_5760 [Trichinella papuae]|uniref:Uncharacterized protein n=1 Tax=Trichinella papuae TaxID=268474 RepID=A0A0V1N3Y8_9BILA|nr:hypothetical protein T10_5760 [Trichinella papuae]
MVVRDRTTPTSAEVLTGGRGSAWREDTENWRCSKLSSLKIIGVEKSFLICLAYQTRSRANASDIKMNEKPEKTTLAEKTQPGERLNSCLSLSTGLGTGPSIWSSLAFPLSSSVSFMLDRFAENKLPALEKADTSHEYMGSEQLLVPVWDNLKALTVTLSQQPHTSLGGKNQYIIGQRMMALVHCAPGLVPGSTQQPSAFFLGIYFSTFPLLIRFRGRSPSHATVTSKTNALLSLSMIRSGLRAPTSVGSLHSSAV